MTTSAKAARWAACGLLGGMALAAAAQSPSRGELLYSTHCIACHSSQMHWREKKLATDWNSLKLQVRRWQGTAALGWNDADIVEVTRFLNERFYRFAAVPEAVSSLGTPSGGVGGLASATQASCGSRHSADGASAWGKQPEQDQR